MKTINKTAAQGELRFCRVKSIPKGLKKIPATKKTIVGHSETGHHHVLDGGDFCLYETENPMIRFLEVFDPTNLVHERSFDQHEPIKFDKGTYEIRHQREYTPQGWRAVQD